MRCPACKPSTGVSRVWLKLDSWFTFGKSWRGRPLTRRTQRMQIRTSPREGLQAAAARMMESNFLEALMARPCLMPKVPLSGPKEGHWLPHHMSVSPTIRFAQLEPQVLRVLLLRRLRLPFPLTALACRCGRPSRRPWPSQVGVCCCWDAGTQGVPSGERGPRRRDQRVCARIWTSLW